jgi:hypothetical protein
LERSPVAVDEVIFADLVADFAAKTDYFVLNGSGSSGQLSGFLNGQSDSITTQSAPASRESPRSMVLSHRRRHRFGGADTLPPMRSW